MTEEPIEARKQAESEVPASFEELRCLLRERAQNGRTVERFNDWELMENLRFTNALYNRTVPGEPGSQRRFLGWLFQKVKRVVVWTLGWYINPMVENQHDFNAYATRTINEMKSYLDHLQVNEDILNTGLKREIALFRTNLMFLNKELELRMREFEKRIDFLSVAIDSQHRMDAGDLPEALGQAMNPDAPLDILTMMQLVYGSPRELKERQRVYLDFFSGLTDAVVVGCGRGELLQLLGSKGIVARGVEANGILAEYCREHELPVQNSDPLEYLASLQDGSTSAIFVTRLTAHYTPARLLRMIRLCSQKLRAGGLLIMEAPSAFPVYAVNVGQPDGTEWAHPLSREVLRFFCLANEFLEPEVISPDPEGSDGQLEELDLWGQETSIEPWQLSVMHTINANFQRIAAALAQYQDYALVTHKNPRTQDVQQMSAALGDSV